MNASKQFFGIIALSIYWALLFFTLRLVFIYKYYNQIDNYLPTLKQGLISDISSIGMMLGLLSLLLPLISIAPQKRISQAIKLLLLIVAVILILIDYSSLILYNEWGSTLSCRAISYLDGSVSAWKTVLAFIDFYAWIYVGLGITFIFVLNQLANFYFFNEYQPSKLKSSIILAIMTLSISVIMIRGGLQKIPRDSSISFFSNNTTENFTAVNKLRYFLDSYIQIHKINTRVDFNTTTTNLSNIRKTMKGHSFIDSYKPNIILIILEGIPNVVFDSIYYREIKIPNLRRLKKLSYSFENMYSSGFRTDQGLLNLLAGIPAYPYINVMKEIENIHHQPTLFQSLSQEGYHTSFLYGGDGQFSHLKKYMLNQPLNHYCDASSFDPSSRIMDWGVPDHDLLNRGAKYIESLDPPYFTTLLTSSTHQPFDFPGNNPKMNSDKENFIGSIEYLDTSLGSIIDSLASSKKNNLIIITSDHGSLYLGHDFNDHKRFNIPFLILGGALQDSLIGKQNYKYFNSHDLPKSIESILNITSNNYPLSSDITSSQKNTSSYWVTEHTMGWLTLSKSIVTNHTATDIYFESNLDTPIKNEQKNALKYFQDTRNQLKSWISKQ